MKTVDRHQIAFEHLSYEMVSAYMSVLRDFQTQTCFYEGYEPMERMKASLEGMSDPFYCRTHLLRPNNEQLI